MKNFLVIGAGRFGRFVCQKLHEAGHQTMLVDKDETRVEKSLAYVTNAVIGNSTDREFLQSLGIQDFDACIVAIGDDFLGSLETTSLLEELGAVKVIARAASSTQEKFLLRNGADEVVFPERQLGYWTAIRCSSDSITNFIELGAGYSIFEIKLPAAWTGKSIRDLDVRRKYGVNILGVRNGKMAMDINGDTILNEGQTILILGETRNIQKRFL